MKALRVNLSISDVVWPELYEALAGVPPRRRAERLRSLADRGLQQARPARAETRPMSETDIEASAEGALHAFAEDFRAIVDGRS